MTSFISWQQARGFVVTHWKYLDLLEIPHTTRGINIVSDDFSDFLGALALVDHHTSQELCVFAFLGMLTEDCT